MNLSPGHRRCVSSTFGCSSVESLLSALHIWICILLFFSAQTGPLCTGIRPDQTTLSPDRTSPCEVWDLTTLLSMFSKLFLCSLCRRIQAVAATAGNGWCICGDLHHCEPCPSWPTLNILVLGSRSNVAVTRVPHIGCMFYSMVKHFRIQPLSYFLELICLVLHCIVLNLQHDFK